MQTTFLAGRVRKQSLPSLSPPLAAGAPTLKRLFLPQGELAQFYDGDEPVRYLAYLELQPGSPRGDHYHLVKNEGVYVIHGELTLVVANVATQAWDQLRLETGDLAFIPTGVAHVLLALVPGQAIEFSSARFDATDIYRFPVPRPPPAGMG